MGNSKNSIWTTFYPLAKLAWGEDTGGDVNAQLMNQAVSYTAPDVLPATGGDTKVVKPRPPEPPPPPESDLKLPESKVEPLPPPPVALSREKFEELYSTAQQPSAKEGDPGYAARMRLEAMHRDAEKYYGDERWGRSSEAYKYYNKIANAKWVRELTDERGYIPMEVVSSLTPHQRHLLRMSGYQIGARGWTLNGRIDFASPSGAIRMPDGGVSQPMNPSKHRVGTRNIKPDDWRDGATWWDRRANEARSLVRYLFWNPDLNVPTPLYIPAKGVVKTLDRLSKEPPVVPPSAPFIVPFFELPDRRDYRQFKQPDGSWVI